MIDNCINALLSLRNALVQRGYSIDSCETVQEPLEFEKRLSETWNEFESLTEAEWDRIRTLADDTAASALLVYSLHMAVLGVRQRDESCVRDSIMALVVDDVVDARDVVRNAVLAYDAAIRIGTDPSRLFQTAIRYASPRRRMLLEYFCSPDYENSIAWAGYEAVETDDGFTYRMSLTLLTSQPPPPA